MIPFRFAILLAFVPSLAAAECEDGSELLISCSFNNGAKTAETCLSGDVATYRFGPTGGPTELEMSRHVRDVDMQPWSGFGRWISEGFTFANGEYRYHFRYAIDKLAEENWLEADLWIGRGETRLAELICDPDSIKTSGYPLPIFDAKVAAGQLWDHEELIWRDGAQAN